MEKYNSETPDIDVNPTPTPGEDDGFYGGNGGETGSGDLTHGDGEDQNVGPGSWSGPSVEQNTGVSKREETSKPENTGTTNSGAGASHAAPQPVATPVVTQTATSAAAETSSKSESKKTQSDEVAKASETKVVETPKTEPEEEFAEVMVVNTGVLSSNQTVSRFATAGTLVVALMVMIVFSMMLRRRTEAQMAQAKAEVELATNGVRRVRNNAKKSASRKAGSASKAAGSAKNAKTVKVVNKTRKQSVTVKRTATKK